MGDKESLFSPRELDLNMPRKIVLDDTTCCDTTCCAITHARVADKLPLLLVLYKSLCHLPHPPALYHLYQNSIIIQPAPTKPRDQHPHQHIDVQSNCVKLIRHTHFIRGCLCLVLHFLRQVEEILNL